MYLSDYHRKNLLEEAAATDGPENGLATYAQQQDDLKNVLVKEMHAAVNGDIDSGDGQSGDNEGDGFLVRKSTAKVNDTYGKQRHNNQLDLDVESADKDPDTFLSNFMSARAWVPSEGSTFQPLESDDDEEDRRAELFEEAYNLRFEDPKTSNEKLLSHARDAAVKYSVRKESINPRKKAREAERAKKEEARHNREEEKARLRKLKVSDAEERIKKIKEAAGQRGNWLQEHDWAGFLDEGWEDARWEEEMKKRFGDEYYEDQDQVSDQSYEKQGGRKRKAKKPKWKDDIDIGDLVPGFGAEENETRRFELTDDDSESGGAPIESGDAKLKSKRKRDEEKKVARQERRKIERLVDQQMEVNEKLSNFGKKHGGYFRYRETSPTAYGLTAQDILMASDSQLNQYAGLKKMAAFRDTENKRKDKKRLGKKARLRQWRKETFGSEQGPQKTLAEVLAGKDVADIAGSRNTNDVDIREGKKKKRSRKGKLQDH